MTPASKKNLLALLLFLMITPILYSQPGAGYQKEYRFLHSGNLVGDKNFYWLTVIDQTPAIQKLLAEDRSLKTIADRRLTLLKAHVSDTCTWPVSLVTDFRFMTAD